MRKVLIGWTVVRGDRPVGQSQSRYGRLSKNVTPVYDTLAKARRKATVSGLSYDAITEAFIEVPD